jgi:hypothetical protein
VLQSEFEQSSLRETHLLSAAAGRCCGAEPGASRRADGCASSSAGKGADDGAQTCTASNPTCRPAALSFTL